MKAVMEILEGRRKSESDSRFPLATPTRAVETDHVTEPFVDAQQAANFLKLHPKTLLRLARHGSIPAHPLTGRRRHIWRFLLSELDAWARGRLDSGSDRCQNSRS